jgi:hypothetical protein
MKYLKLIGSSSSDLSETQYTGPVLFLPWLIKFAPRLTRWNQFLESVESVHKFLQGIIESHKETFDDCNIRDFIDAYLLEIQRTTDPNSSFYGEVGGNSFFFKAFKINLKLIFPNYRTFSPYCSA